jgi:hypothetical protein
MNAITKERLRGISKHTNKMDEWEEPTGFISGTSWKSSIRTRSMGRRQQTLLPNFLASKLKIT